MTKEIKLTRGFVTQIDAAVAYDVAAKNVHKEFAYLNFLTGVKNG